MQRIRKAIRLRTRLKQLVHPTIQMASRWLLSRRMWGESSLLSSHTALLLSIYRHKNASTLLPLVLEAQRNKWEIRLWALDEIHPSLASFTRGVGQGSKFPILNSLLDGHGWSGFDWVIIADDDVILERGSLKLLLRTAEEAGFSLAQPAHSHLSYRSHDITLLVPFSIARLTTFIEIGPIFAVHRSLHSQILPFPEGYGMGWGLDIRWSDLARAGARLGIVDLVAVGHISPIASQYTASVEIERVRGLLKERGAKSIVELQRTLDVWRPWRRRPPWAARFGPS